MPQAANSSFNNFDAIYTSFIVVFHTVQGSQPENRALNQPTWSTTNATFQPSSLAVDGIARSTAFITTEDVWPFLAVDLGARFNLDSIAVGIYFGECLFALNVD